MATASSIEWTDATWNPIAGCTPVSAGCRNCYAARMALRLAQMSNGAGRKYRGTAAKTRGGVPVFTGRINLDHDTLDAPRRWRTRRMIFVNSMSDLFHEAVPADFVHEVFKVMSDCPQHTFQVLTKRPVRALELAPLLPWAGNVWLGTSVEDDRVIDRARILRRVPASIRFLSCEPLLGPLPRIPLQGLHWVIVGGESGPGARPMEEAWVLQIKRQCQMRGIPFFFKQWGGVNKKASGRLLQGRTWDELPEGAMLGA
jgi:protein gp37